MPAPGELHSIDGLQLHINCVGPASSVTIVIEAGAGTVSPVYARLQRELARKYRVCVYDRPGLGWSEPDTEPLDGERNARRLHALLAAADVHGPLLLIGHSIGGLLNRIYVGLYPDQVAAVMMLDASHPQQFGVIGDSMDAQLAAVVEVERAKRLKYRTEGTRPAEFAAIEAIFADMPEVLEQMAATYTPDALDTMALEMQGTHCVADQAGASPDLGDRPMLALWAAQKAGVGGSPGIEAVHALWPDYQRQHAALSKRGRERMVPGAEHMTLAMLPPFVALIADEVDTLVAQLGPVDH
ncbi:alpha/beta hydrolase [Paucibacter sp. R3-3]|uniref:Alpha/beta hydrolase n=1 Tax=Roseateles agri TaxID=3098619 RepID=A0ABU5DAU4_9BURK|nr:alpha/beta hydrolase [Paucibacter sp. R3-3]MDY0743365.1 alpha/beta hydrolase [Paucibacter sp. R3-3]